MTINLGFTIILSIVWILYDSSRWGFSWLQRILLLIFSVWAPTVSTPMHVVNIFTAEVDFGHKPPRTSWTMFYLYSTLSLVSLFAVLPLWTIYARDAAAMEVFLKLSPSLPPLTSFLLQSQASWLSSITVRTLVTLIPPLVGWSSQVSGSFGFLLFLPLSFVCLPCVVAGSLALKELRYLYEKSIEWTRWRTLTGSRGTGLVRDLHVVSRFMALVKLDL